MLALAAAGCERSDGDAERPATDAPIAFAEDPVRVRSVDGIEAPLAAVHDADADVYFVASGAGYIARVTPGGAPDSLRFIEGGRGGVELASPVALAIVGGTLWVLDGTMLRAFDRATGAPAGAFDLAAAGAVAPGDLAAAGDSALYVADARAGRIWRIDSSLDVWPVLPDSTPPRPEAIAWDPVAGRLLIASGAGAGLLSWTPGSTDAVAVAPGAPLSGIAVFPDGGILVASAEEANIYRIDGARLVPAVPDVAAPAIAPDARRGRLLVPFTAADRLEVWGARGDA
ncbi:MAG: hypothetical protein ACRELV_00145 [Longimicrobiales bacterium]